MLRRRFLSVVGASSISVSSYLYSESSVSADIKIGSVESAFPKNVDTVLVDFKSFKLLSKYIDESVQSDVSVVMRLDGEVVDSFSDTVQLKNNRYTSINDRIGYLSAEDLDFSGKTVLTGRINVRITHPSLPNDATFRKNFSITGLDPVAHWPLTDSSVSGDGGVVEDLSGNGFDGTTKNGVTTDASGYSGTAFEFDGSSTYISLPSLDGVHSSDGDRTVSAWVYADDHSDAYNHVFQYGTGSTNNAFSIATRSDTGLSEHTWGSSPSRNSVSSVPTGQWVHLAITYNKATSTRTYYIDGSSVGSITDQGAPDTQFSNARIGARLNDLTEYWDGRIQDVRLYDEALTQSQIDSVMKLVEYI